MAACFIQFSRAWRFSEHRRTEMWLRCPMKSLLPIYCESVSERILKISQHMVKLRATGQEDRFTSTYLRRRQSRGTVFTGVCLSVCLSVYPHDVSKTAAARITKRDTEMFHHESCMETHLLWGQKVTVQGHEAQKQCRRGLLHSCDCWLHLVIMCCGFNFFDSRCM